MAEPSIKEDIDELRADKNLFHQIVHGDENTTVTTESGVQPSLKKVVADAEATAQAQVNISTNAAAGHASNASDSEQAAGQHAVDAGQSKQAAQEAKSVVVEAESRVVSVASSVEQDADRVVSVVADLNAVQTAIESELSSRLAPAIANATVMSGDQYNGWVLRLRLHDWAVGGSYSFSPEVAKNVRLTVFGDGYSDECMPIRVSREILGTVVVRKPYPDHAVVAESDIGADVELQIALSDFVYEGEEVYLSTSHGWAENDGGVSRETIGNTMLPVANESTLKYPEVIAKWSIVPHQLIEGAAHLECVAAHAYAANRGMLAAVRFELKGRSSGLTKSEVVSQMEISGWRVDAHPVQVYQCDIDTAGFTPGEMLDARFIAYPKVGNATTVRDTADQPFPSVQLPADLPLVMSDGSATPYAYVDPVSGNDGVGVVSNDAAVARASTFATIRAAAAGIETFGSRGHIGGGEIRLMEGDHAGLGASMSSLAAGDQWLTITRDPLAARSAVKIKGGTNDDLCNRVRLWDIRLEPIAPDAILFDGTDVEAETAIWLDDIDVDGDGGSLPMLYRIGYIYITGLHATNAGEYMLKGYSTTVGDHILTRGVVTDASGDIEAHCVIGCTWRGKTLIETVPAANRAYQDGAIIAFNAGMSLTAPAVRLGSEPTAIGRAIFGNVFESIQTTQPVLSVSADGIEVPTHNILMFHNTAVGARANIGYNDSGDEFVLKDRIFSRGNIFMEWNHKDDVFLNPVGGQSAARVGSWSVGYKVGVNADLILQGESTGRQVADEESWLGEYIGINCRVGSAAFVDDRSTNNGATGAGQGDYRLATAGDAIRLPAKLVALPFDLAGVPRKRSVSAAGAYEY